MLSLSEDPDLYKVIQKEVIRQESCLDLIASENITSPAIREAVGSVLTNKYAEGYPGHRYYGGCEYVDEVENLARERAKQLFSAEYANVQPHSGSQANMAILLGFLHPGDTILGMHLTAGGHLTHGSTVNFSGKLFNAISYGVHPETSLINYEEIRTIAHREKPKLIIAGFSSYPRSICFETFAQIADEVGAYLLADIAHIAGLVATGLHASPVPYADFVTTTTHKTLRGPRGGLILMGSKGAQCRLEGLDNKGKSVCKMYAEVIDNAIFPLTQGGPLMHIIAGKAACFHEALQPSFRTYQEQVLKNAQKLGEVLVQGGLKLVSGGTDNHLCLVDLRPFKGLTGKEAENILGQVGIVVNKNVIPFDTVSPLYASGIRIGTPVLTTRGMKEAEMVHLGEYMVEALRNRDDENILRDIRKKTLRLAQEFPLGFL